MRNAGISGAETTVCDVSKERVCTLFQVVGKAARRGKSLAGNEDRRQVCTARGEGEDDKRMTTVLQTLTQLSSSPLWTFQKCHWACHAHVLPVEDIKAPSIPDRRGWCPSGYVLVFVMFQLLVYVA